MAITQLITKDGYVENLAAGRHAEVNKGKFELVEKFVGCVLGLGENNYYDDSDFYAIVWNEEKQMVENVYYDTTRAYSPYTANIDATEEVRAKAKAYNESVIRKNRAKALAEINSQDRKIAIKNDVPIKALRKLRKDVGAGRYESCVELLSKNLRSSFRKSLRDQLIKFLRSTDNKYTSPFSYKQWDYL